MTKLDTHRSASVLMVVDQLPFPPRNGVTLPTFHYAEGLMKSHRLKLVLLADEASPIDQQSFKANESLFGCIPTVFLRRKGKCTRVASELAGREMYNQGWELSRAPEELRDYRADVLLASPFSAVAKWQATRLSGAENFGCTIAGVNDCSAAEYYYRGTQSFGNTRLALKGILDRARAGRISLIEAGTLASYDHILMQTSTDQQLMRRLVSGDIADHVTIVPNGVRRELLDVVPKDVGTTAVFIAELSSEYAPIANWLVSTVWPAVIKKVPDARLLIVGKGASPTLKAAIGAAGGTEHVEFVDDLRSVYEHASIAICPVFKGYGLINKTLEAMACGVPVIGGEAAFNGIEGFKDGEHGLICRPRHTGDFATAIGNLLADHAFRAQLGKAGRKLIDGQFRWESAVDKIRLLIVGSRGK